jgi:hypothetical protein
VSSPRDTLRVLVVAVFAPLAVVLVTAGLMLTWTSSVPNPVAVHWGEDGRPDGAGSAASIVILVVVLGFSFIAILGGIVVFVSHRGGLSRMMKLAAVLVLWFSALVSIAMAWSLAEQRGIASWRDAPSPLPGFALGFAVGLVLAVAAWFSLPRAIGGWQAVPPQATPALALQPTERASWHHNVALPAAFAWLWLLLSVLLVGTAVLEIVTSGGRLWPLSLIPVVILFAVFATFSWTIRVDASGVVARSTVGVPWVRVPLSDIAGAEIVRVDPFRQFGGWGIRWGLNRDLGIVLRSGDALRVERKTGRSLVVTVDDAASAAALLNGLVQREAGGSKDH